MGALYRIPSEKGASRKEPCADTHASRPRAGLQALIPKCVLQSRKCFFENRARRGKIKAEPCVSAWSKLLAGTGKDAGAIPDPVGNLLGRQIGSGKIDPREIGGVEAHRARAWHCGLNARIE